MSARLIQAGAAVVGALVALSLLGEAMIRWADVLPDYFLSWQYRALVGAVGAGLGLITGPWVAARVRQAVGGYMSRLLRLPASDLVAGTVGLIIGLAVSGLLVSALPDHLPLIGSYLPLVFAAVFTYVAVKVSILKWPDLRHALTGEAASRRARSEGLPRNGSGTEVKILDTSVIIDGRVADIARTGFLEGTLVVPGFVLRELQHIADSPDVLRRNRGRRGLDILKQMQSEAWVDIQVVDQDFDDVLEVDAKLVRLAKLMGGKVMTNDFNLNKVAELHGVPVLNINELANALKPAVLPGEEMRVHVIRDGKEQGQGVAYLDDGTMIVVEGGRRYIGTDVDVTVTSVLQTSAGRMIFARPHGPTAVVSGERVKVARGTG